MIDVMVVQNPYEMGRLTVPGCSRPWSKRTTATITEMFPNQGEPDGDLYNTGMRVVVPDEGSPLSADLFGTEYRILQAGRLQAVARRT